MLSSITKRERPTCVNAGGALSLAELPDVPDADDEEAADERNSNNLSLTSPQGEGMNAKKSKRSKA
jgi:hypothetical protein